MKGLYLNLPGAADAARAMNRVLEAPGEIVEARSPRGDTVVVSHHAADWPEGAIFSSPEEGIFAAASGWILSEGRFGDLPRFARAAATHLRRDQPALIRGLVDAGAFTLFLLVDGTPSWITDPFGLHPHYVAAENPFRHAAPAPSMLAGDREPDPELAEILETQNHLFGDYTGWKEIFRISPGQVIEKGRRTDWFEYSGGGGNPSSFPSA